MFNIILLGINLTRAAPWGNVPMKFLENVFSMPEVANSLQVTRTYNDANWKWFSEKFRVWPPGSQGVHRKRHKAVALSVVVVDKYYKMYIFFLHNEFIKL